jgi:hypothetical protein
MGWIFLVWIMSLFRQVIFYAFARLRQGRRIYKGICDNALLPVHVTAGDFTEAGLFFDRKRDIVRLRKDHRCMGSDVARGNPGVDFL